jgi:hypothetical protein
MESNYSSPQRRRGRKEKLNTEGTEKTIEDAGEAKQIPLSVAGPRSRTGKEK